MALQFIYVVKGLRKVDPASRRREAIVVARCNVARLAIDRYTRENPIGIPIPDYIDEWRRTVALWRGHRPKRGPMIAYRPTILVTMALALASTSCMDRPAPTVSVAGLFAQLRLVASVSEQQAPAGAHQ